MKKKKEFDRRALYALGTVVALAPALRLLPTQSVALAGRCAWLSSLAALPALLVYAPFLYKLMEKRADGEGLSELTLRLLGKKAGAAALCVMSAWFILYAGFVLRSGSDRLIVTVYPSASPALFTLVMTIPVLLAILGRRRSIVRAAQLIRPLVLGVLLVILFFAMLSLKTENLLPVTVSDIVPILKGSVAAVDVTAAVMYALCLLEGGTEKEDRGIGSFIWWIVRLLLLFTLLCVAIVGVFGAELTGRLSHPFFVLVRNLVFFRTVERVEALVVMLWIFPDFLLVSLFLYAAQSSLRLAFGFDCSIDGGVRDFSNGRWMIWLCAALAATVALLIAPDGESLSLWSGTVIPILNMGFAFLVLPAIYIVGKIRNSI